MSHALPTLQVVTGIVFALLTYHGATTATYLDEFLVFGTLFVLGLILAVYGLFRGIEGAVATATAPDEDESEAE
ncbi:hypothetical protein Hrd1104_00115 [Halorhabdus sp. CBA1104]|uniref:hypothetical protein n=1 Tax=Halorhabdus sp. CBA1104 TaxID=1380432 RepID=UPI0012B4357E|nr:hypothetical protein [Halorhabdus sp. CBA1104]QGN05849.1 hypothetical protein Hrd1104_00115 [Halorhabdus sp. CBA1104]